MGPTPLAGERLRPLGHLSTAREMAVFQGFVKASPFFALGARAADAVVVAEPEPVEYVRVCDVYGAGFYYMPGTETCLKVSGYMRYDIGVGDINGLQSIDKKDFLETNGEDRFTDETWNKIARFQLRVDARSETELGTLRAYVAANFQWDTDNLVVWSQALMAHYFLAN